MMESRKLKGTPVLWLPVLAPLFVVVNAWVAAWLTGDRVYHQGLNPWIDFAGHILIGWTLFVYPIYTSLLAALFHGIEHRASAWKMIYALPVPRRITFLSKLALFTGLITISQLLLWGLAEVGGTLLGLLKPAFGFQHYSLHGVLFRGSAGSLLSGLGLAAFQFCLAFRFSGFIVPAGFGLLMTMTGAISRSWSVSQASPFLWPVCFFNNSIEMGDWQYRFVLFGVMLYVLMLLTVGNTRPRRI